MRFLLKNIFLLTLLIFSVFSCIDKIDIELPDKEAGIIAIQGKLSIAETGFVEVYLSRSFSFSGATAGPRDVLGAQIYVIDNNGHNIHLEGGLLNGFYRASFNLDTTSLNTSIGAQYQLLVKTPDDKEYISTQEGLLELPKADHLSFVKKNKEITSLGGISNTIPVIELAISTPLNTISTSNQRLAWSVQSTYKITDTPISCNWPIDVGIPDEKTCYVNSFENISSNLFFDGTAVTIDRLDNFILYDQVITGKFSEGLYFNVVQQSLNKGAFDYLKNIQQLLERSGNMFDPLPGVIKSNISNKKDTKEPVYGYFYATLEDTIRIYVSPEAAGNPEHYCPPPVSEGTSTLENDPCCNCLITPGSTVQKPAYWQF